MNTMDGILITLFHVLVLILQTQNNKDYVVIIPICNLYGGTKI